ncbi:MAG: hypothetical protein RMK52_01395 [Chitinophagales bacterium]|nr:hypothetical protein [Chitinophagales bacterium]MDW8392877.1 hypothetical protein [Chitinophagales bacterium]
MPNTAFWRSLPVLLILVLTAVPIQAQKPRTFCIAFYNVENLFDNQDDPKTEDEEFTAEGKARWTTERMNEKVRNIARVIAAINEGNGPDVLGLSEVENEAMLKTLLRQGGLDRKGYRYLHADSRDQRGIDVCLVYREKSFRPISYRLLPVDVSAYDSRPTRDILMVTGIAAQKDTLHLFVNHWPSRRGGREVTAPKRMAAARVLRRTLDSLFARNPEALVVAMGDFNDNPGDASVNHLQYSPRSEDLRNCMSRFDWKAGQGTEFYQGSWYRFIQILLSPSMGRYSFTGDESDPCSGIHIFRPDWILKEDSTGQRIPRRSVEQDGTIGYSDHLPVYLLLRW